jgi:hypothetical protein
MELLRDVRRPRDAGLVWDASDAGRLRRVKSLFPLGLLLVLGALMSPACESAPSEPAPAAEPTPPPPPPLDTFSAERALADDVALAQRRAQAGDGSYAELRSYIASELAATELAVETIETPGVQDAAAGVARSRSWSQLVATATGASPDLFVLVARLGEAVSSDTGEALREEVSGAALLLELGRVLSTRTLPYTTRFVWVEGDGGASGAEEKSDASDTSGSAALVASWKARGDLERIRLLVALGRVCRDDLRIARDLRSNRVHRENFYEVAVRAGRVATFPRNQEYESVDASHLAFRSAGVRPIVALTAASGIPFEGHTCTAQSLEAVGVVTLEALNTIGQQLAKIDRFARSPLASPNESAAPATSTPSRPTESVPYGPEPANP